MSNSSKILSLASIGIGGICTITSLLFYFIVSSKIQSMYADFGIASKSQAVSSTLHGILFLLGITDIGVGIVSMRWRNQPKQFIYLPLVCTAASILLFGYILSGLMLSAISPLNSL